MTEILINKYRPSTWDDVIGQDTIVNSVQKLLDDGKSQAFIFSGPPGTGKTTLSRIAAEYVEAEILDLAAAKYTGIDDMRAITDALQYKAFGKCPNKAIILDEVHRLSKQAFDSLLKPIEEPPPHVFWFFLTTELSKIPVAIKTRCSSFVLKPVKEKELQKLIKDIAKEEKFKVGDDIIDIIVREANGSPRQAISNLGLVYNITDRKTAIETLKSAIESDATIELCRFLLKKGSWKMAMSIINKLDGENSESIRIVISNYFGKVAKEASSEDSACAALSVLEAFATPFNSSDGLAPLMIAVGRCLFTD